MREKFYQKVASGSLDDRLIEIEVKEQNGNLVSVEFMPIMGEEIDSLRDNFANLFPKKKKIKKFKVKDAIKYFQQEESEKLSRSIRNYRHCQKSIRWFCRDFCLWRCFKTGSIQEMVL